MMTTHVNNEHITYDAFLSEHLGEETYKVTAGKSLDEETRTAVRDLQARDVFLYCKIPVENMTVASQLAALKFQLVDNLVTLEKEIKPQETAAFHKEIRLANPADEAATVEVARSSFQYSRFHADQRIDNAHADRVKAEWVRNFFRGKRGTDMVLGIVNGEVAGFSQLLRAGDVLVIDLIAVAPTARKRGLATDMINYAQQYCRGNCGKYRVGTQMANIPSINLYQNLGFTVTQKDYVYHYHT
ncbi:MAG: GNAT family N-acetyltransferase [Candidatus Omnitrophica bacterium]|nr:GNAT family N-acetyltransferase [Candidatus Omnitrophota bacterium]